MMNLKPMGFWIGNDYFGYVGTKPDGTPDYMEFATEQEYLEWIQIDELDYLLESQMEDE